MKKEVVVFRKLIGTVSKMQYVERIKDNGVIESLRVRFYPGVENTLQVNAYVNHKIKSREELVSYNELTDNFISGDNDYFIYPIYIPVQYDDELVIEVLNPDTVNSYTLSVDVIIAYDGEAY